jgi:hypothetical protein
MLRVRSLLPRLNDSASIWLLCFAYWSLRWRRLTISQCPGRHFPGGVCDFVPSGFVERVPNGLLQDIFAF